MTVATFMFEGNKGCITRSGFVHWRTLSCDVQCLVGRLKKVALSAQATIL